MVLGGPQGQGLWVTLRAGPRCGAHCCLLDDLRACRFIPAGSIAAGAPDRPPVSCGLCRRGYEIDFWAPPLKSGAVMRMRDPTITMGLRDPKQKQLTFDAARDAWQHSSTSGVMGPPTDTEDGGTLGDTARIMAKLRAGFRAIDARFDTLTNRFDWLNEHLDSRTT
ncbi:hypothetical protein NDU88_001155 [Pleurodeles waltl]|uniref:Uncharacterized protein n=1 Tax=Pleurodeles waltl TaxID=8319 RepID=A0AAV7RBS5_PLEWA|nr:hypothetical protein NDU88_001155 [Pleurodeles waltl]